MAKKSLRREAVLLLRLNTPMQKSARLFVLREQWGTEYAEAVAAKADELSTKKENHNG